MTSNVDSLNRTEDIKNKIRSLWSKPIVIDNFLHESEMEQLKKSILSVERTDCVSGKEGQSLVINFLQEKNLPPFFFDKINGLLKDFSIKNMFAFDSNRPFMLHTDSGLNSETIPYKNLTFCLEENTFEEQLVLFNAFCYFSVSITDFKSFFYSKEVLENYNYLLATPDKFINSINTLMLPAADEKISENERKLLLNHIPEDLYSQFSIVDVIKFKYNRMIIFDSCQLHSGSSLKPVTLSGNLKRMGIFTELRE